MSRTVQQCDLFIELNIYLAFTTTFSFLYFFYFSIFFVNCVIRFSTIFYFFAIIFDLLFCSKIFQYTSRIIRNINLNFQFLF